MSAYVQMALHICLSSYDQYMNKVKLQGTVASTIQIRETQSGRKVTNFRIAVPRYRSESMDYFTIVAWQADAQYVQDNVSEGDTITVLGRLATSTWKEQTKVEVVAKNGGITLDAKGEAPAAAPAVPAAPAAEPSKPAAASGDSEFDITFSGGDDDLM